MSNTTDQKGSSVSHLPPKKPQVKSEQLHKPGDKPSPKPSSTANAPGGTGLPPFPPYHEIVSSALHSNYFTRKNAPHQIGPNSAYNRFECIPSEDEELPPLVDWIALFFTIESDDVVATAITENSQDVTIYVALNKGMETNKHNAAWENFKAALTKAFGGQASNARDCSSYDFVLSLMLSHGWEKALSRVRKLQMTLRSRGASSGQLGKLQGIIETWSRQHKSEEGKRRALEKTMKLLSAVDEANVIGNTNDETASRKLDFFKTVINECRTIAELDYLRNGVVHTANPWIIPFGDESDPCKWVDQLKEEDQLFLVEFSYSLQRLLDYHVGLEHFLAHGAKSLFGKLFHENKMQVQSHLKVIWVTSPSILKLDNVHRLVWKVGSEDWFLGMPQHLRGILHIKKGKEEVAVSAIRKECAGFWKKDDVIATNTHVEIKLVYVLKHEGVTTKYNIIGVSSPLCIACEAYFDGIANGERPTKRWAIRESSGKFVKDWLCPPSNPPVGSQEWAQRAIAVVRNGAGGYYYTHLKGVIKRAGALEEK